MVLGWKFIELVERPSRAVLIEYPHTSKRDAFYGLPANFALGAGVPVLLSTIDYVAGRLA